MVEHLLNQQAAREKEHNDARRRKLVRDALADNNLAYADMLRDERQTSVSEIRRLVRETHDGRWEAMCALKQRQEAGNEMLGLTEAERKRLDRFVDWEGRELRGL